VRIRKGPGSRGKIVNARFSKFCGLATPRLAIKRLADATDCTGAWQKRSKPNPLNLSP